MALLAFDVGGAPLAIDLAAVREVLAGLPVTRLPSAPEALRGVVNVRGTIVPVLDVAVRLGGRRADLAGPLVVADARDGRCALLVDAVHGILEVPDDRLLARPDAGPLAGAACVVALAPAEAGGFVPVLDLDALLDPPGVASARAAAPAPAETAGADAPSPPTPAPVPPPGAPAAAPGADVAARPTAPPPMPARRDRDGRDGRPPERLARDAGPFGAGVRATAPAAQHGRGSAALAARAAAAPVARAAASAARPVEAEPRPPRWGRVLVGVVALAVATLGLAWLASAHRAAWPPPLGPLTPSAAPAMPDRSRTVPRDGRGDDFTTPPSTPTPTPTSTQTPTPPPAPAPARTPPPSAAATPSLTVTVRPGDTLWDLSRRLEGSPWAWPRLHRANAAEIPDPDRIAPGQRLVVPPRRAR